MTKINLNIHSIPELQEALDNAFESVISFIEKQSDDQFETSTAEGKWSTGEQLEHLIKSVIPINTGLILPKTVLKLRFGTTDRTEMNFEQLRDLYQSKLAEGAKATKPYIPNPIPASKKASLISKYRSEKEKLTRALNKWDEKSISKIVAPHPILGNITIRELIFFTVYHNYHHLESIKSIM